MSDNLPGRARDRYSGDVLAAERARRARSLDPPTVVAGRGLVVEDPQSGWCGAVVRVEKAGGVHVVSLEDRRGAVRSFPLGPGFWVEGRSVTLVAPRGPAPAPAPTRTASGSRAVAGQRARTARGSRIWVEGRHDAELVEQVWGDDLRVEGVVVEPLHGIDDLAAAVADFAPGPGRRLGVLVDHLVAGSKETREADAVAAGRYAGHVLVVGHPYVDVWQSVRPQRVGLAAWPVVPPGRPWKEGVLQALGWDWRTPADVADGWRRIRTSVRSYADLEPGLLGPVEHLIDFVTADPGDR